MVAVKSGSLLQSNLCRDHDVALNLLFITLSTVIVIAPDYFASVNHCTLTYSSCGGIW